MDLGAAVAAAAVVVEPAEPAAAQVDLAAARAEQRAAEQIRMPAEQ